MRNARNRPNPALPRPTHRSRCGARPRSAHAPARTIGFLPVLLALASLAGSVPDAAGGDGPPARASDLFEATKVWTIHLRFTPEQWARMEPKEQSRTRPRPAFGTGTLLAPAMMRDGDQDRDRKLSQGELRDLGARWFAAWDRDGDGLLDPAQVRAGLKEILAPAGQGGAGSPGLNLVAEPGRRNGVASVLLGLDFEYVHAELEFEGKTFPDVAVRYKGNGTFMESRGSLKRPFKIDLNKFVKGQKLAGVATLNLQNNVTDAGMMNEVLSYGLYRDAGVPAPRTAYARVFVTVPGQHDRKYLGVYALVENVDKDFVADRGLAPGGAILKPSTADVFTDLGDDWTTYAQMYDAKTELTAAQKGRIIEFCRLVTQANDAEFAARLGDYVDLDEFARFLAVTVWTGDLDGILTVGQNYYAHLDPKSGRLRFIPWDRDHSFGAWGGRDYAERVQHSVREPWQGRKRFLERVFGLGSFRNHYLAAMTRFSQEEARPDQIAGQVAELATAIRPAVAEESPEKLARFEAVVAGKPLPPSGPFGFGSPAPTLLAFARDRSAAVDDQLAGRSEGQVLGRPRPGDRRPPEFHPEEMVEPALLNALDADHDRKLGRDEFVAGFGKWAAVWAGAQGDALSEDKVRDGLNAAVPLRFGPPPRGGR